MSTSEKVARAMSLVSEDSEMGGLLQFLAAYMNFKGLSVADLREGTCAAAGRETRSNGGALSGWMAETICWLKQPGIFDLVRWPS
jgi:hypothetical protein